MSTQKQSPGAVSERISALERANRRLSVLVILVSLAGFLSVGWLMYRQSTDFVDENRWARNVMFYTGDEALFSPRDRLDLAMGRTFTWSGSSPLRGHIGASANRETAGARFYDTNGRMANLSVSEAGGSVLHLSQDGRHAFLGTDMYDGQLLLELVSADGQQGVRLGLGADDKPVLEVIRDGEVQPLAGR